jgi:zinc ribbon protein
VSALENLRCARYNRPVTSRLLRLAGALLILTLSLGAYPAQAQGTIALSSLTIELWPEFDKPATLVILNGTLASSVPLPAQLTLHIPAASGGPFAVAAQDASGKLVNTQYTTAPSGDTIAVSLTVDFPTFHAEYYDPALTITGEARDYIFHWTTDYAVTAATVRVQEPVDARDLTAEPAVTPAGTADFGLNYYAASLGALSAGQSRPVHLRYSKSTSTLSSEVVNKNTPVPLATTTVTQPLPSQLPLTPILLAAAGGFGVLMIGFGVWSYVRNRRGTETEHARRRRRRTASLGDEPPAPPRAEAPTPARFCVQCGQLLLTGDRFCRNCGTPIRS